MKEKPFNIEVFNSKTSEEKIDYLHLCILEIPDKKFLESPAELERRIVEFKKSTDLGSEGAKNMIYMLTLIKKHKIDGSDDHIIIDEYEKYVSDSVVADEKAKC